MKKENLFIRALKTEDGKNNFLLMIVFIILTFLVSMFFADRKWYDTAVWIISFMSLVFGSNLCKVMIAIKQRDDEDER